uniref:Bacterial Ig domain-containing protein n=1 Tax=candidate division WWE3 bacterium TaxID=2053526 RepID=A0A831YZT2_UNCKA
MRSRKYLAGRKSKIGFRQSWKNLSREDRNDLLNFLKVLGIILAVIGSIYFVGINGLIYIGGFWNIFTGEKGPTLGDTTAPPPPTFAPLAPYTNTETISISGFAEPTTEIILFVNGTESTRTVAEAGGTFNFPSVVLNTEGRNAISATATDGAGNVSPKSAELIVTLDKTPPEIEILSPQNGQAFSGENNQIHVEGKTEPGITVRVNENQAAMLADGTFRSTVTAAAGEIKITIVATDKAGNEKKAELKVSYAP